MLQVQKQATLKSLAQYPRKFSWKRFNSRVYDLSAGTEQSFTGSGSSNQSNSLTGLISVHVVRVFGNGNLEILGQKKLL